MGPEMPSFKGFLSWCLSNDSLSFTILFFPLVVSFLLPSLSSPISVSHHYSVFVSFAPLSVMSSLEDTRMTAPFPGDWSWDLLWYQWSPHSFIMTPLLSIFFSSIFLHLISTHLHLRLLTCLFSMHLLTSIFK